MKALFYFKNEIAEMGTDNTTAYRYPIIQSVLQGYVRTCTQRVHTNLTELPFIELPNILKAKLIFPLSNSVIIGRLGRRKFLSCNTIYAIYFSNLTKLDMIKLDSYLLASDVYLGCSVPHFLNERIFYFDRRPPFLKIKYKSISILFNNYFSIEQDRDIILEEVIKHIPFDSWNYEKAESRTFFFRGNGMQRL